MIKLIKSLQFSINLVLPDVVMRLWRMKIGETGWEKKIILAR